MGRLAGSTRIAKKKSLFIFERGGSGFGRCQNFTDVLVDRRVIVNYKNTMVHAASPSLARSTFAADSGSSRTKVAPLPGPSLRAQSEPPISLAASAPLCNP